MRGNTIILIVMTLFWGCEKPIEWDQADRITPRLVVDAMLTNQPGLSYVVLSLPVTDPNIEPQPVSGATVRVTDGTIIVDLTEDPGNPGTYFPPPGIVGVVNRAYRLLISFSGYTFQADAYMIPVAPLPQFNYSPVESKPGYYVIHPSESNPPTYTKYTVDWKDQEAPFPDIRSLFYSYSLRTIDVNQFFKPPQEKLVFPADARVARARYSMTPGYENYIRSLLSETEWSGGWFDVLPGNLPTNLSAGAVGYFAACSVVIDTVYFN